MAAAEPLLKVGDQLIPLVGHFVFLVEDFLPLLTLATFQFLQLGLDGCFFFECGGGPRLATHPLDLFLGVLQRLLCRVDLVLSPALQPFTGRGKVLAVGIQRPV